MNLKHYAMRTTAATLNRLDGLPFAPLFAGLGHILMFHRVTIPSDRPRIQANAYLEVTPEFLTWTIDYFRSYGYHFLSLDQLLSGLSRGNLSVPFVVYTFDDGFKDNLTHAYPILKSEEVPFCIYVTTDFPDGKAMLWWNTLERVLLSSQRLKITLDGQQQEFDLADPLAKTYAFQKLHHWIKQGSDNTIEQRLQQFYQQLNEKPYDEVHNVALNWKEIVTLDRDALVTIGAHTISHPVLSRVSKKRMQREVECSRDILNKHLGYPPVHFCYPFGGNGEFGKRESTHVQLSGFKSATSTMSSNIHAGHCAHPFALPRIAVGLSMKRHTFDLIRHGVIPMIRNRGRRLVTLPL